MSPYGSIPVRPPDGFRGSIGEAAAKDAPGGEPQDAEEDAPKYLVFEDDDDDGD